MRRLGGHKRRASPSLLALLQPTRCWLPLLRAMIARGVATTRKAARVARERGRRAARAETFFSRPPYMKRRPPQGLTKGAVPSKKRIDRKGHRMYCALALQATFAEEAPGSRHLRLRGTQRGSSRAPPLLAVFE